METSLGFGFFLSHGQRTCMVSLHESDKIILVRRVSRENLVKP